VLPGGEFWLPAGSVSATDHGNLFGKRHARIHHKRKISGGTVSDKGREARDVMLGLALAPKNEE
jgi:hypothetical protein